MMDGEAWHAAIRGVAKSWTRLSNWTENPKGLILRYANYIHSNVLSLYISYGLKKINKHTIVVGWMLIFLQVEALTSNVMVYGRGAFRRCLG